MQRQLLVTEIEADHFGQKVVGVVGQSKLNSALREVVLGQILEVLQSLRCEQLTIQNDVVFGRQTFAQLFEIRLNERAKAGILPVRQKPIKPRAVHEFCR